MISSFHEPTARTERYAKDAGDETFFAALNERLAGEWPVAAAPSVPPEQRAIVYLAGMPRGGTTLLSQLMVRHLSIGYINNLTARFWLRPSAGIRLTRILYREDRAVSLESDYGVTAGPLGPHEFGYFWRHWLRMAEAPTHDLGAEHLAKVDAPGLQGVLRDEIVATLDSGVMFKNPTVGYQASFLARVHPRSLFVWVDRETYPLAASFLRARLERYGSFASWWSVKPATYPFPGLGEDPAADVLRQIEDSRRAFARERAASGVHSIEVSYEALCREPARELSRIADAAAGVGSGVSMISRPAEPLTPAPAKELPPELAARLRELL